MSAESALYALLTAAAPVTALVGARIYPVVAPEGTPTPLIAYELVSNTRQPRIDALASAHLARARVTVNLVSADHAVVKTLRAAVVAACQFQRGAIAGVSVVSVIPDFDGPVGFDGALGLFSQGVDFMVTLFE